MKDSNRVSGNAATTCPFYEEIDAILGTRAASTPAGLLDSSTGADVVLPSEDDMASDSPEASLEETPAETSNSATTHTTADDSANSSTAITSTTSSGSTAATTTTTTSTTTTTGSSSRSGITATACTTTTSSSTGSGLSSSRSTGIRQRSARNAAGRLAGAKRTSDIILALAEMEEHADERAQRWEEKRRKQDAELEERRREAEMRHEERMQSMFMSVFQQMMMGGGWTPAPYPIPPVAGTFPPWPSTTTEESDNDSLRNIPTTSGQ